MSYTVYSILEDGKTVYVGMTNNMQRRKREQRYKRKLDGRHTFHTFAYGIDKEAAVFLEENLIKNTIQLKMDGMSLVVTAAKDYQPLKMREDFPKVTTCGLSGNEKVLCVETGDVFNTVKDCAENMGITETVFIKSVTVIENIQKLHFEYIE